MPNSSRLHSPRPLQATRLGERLRQLRVPAGLPQKGIRRPPPPQGQPACGERDDAGPHRHRPLHRVRDRLAARRPEQAAADDIHEAIRLANDSRYGLSAGIFTRDIDAALRFARECESGNIHINWGPAWRADLMPYGGLKDSGLGREGPKYAIGEMTELKTVVVHLDS